MQEENLQEGVIKFRLEHADRLQFSDDNVSEIESYRKLCIKLAIIGQDGARYQGFGFGNISIRTFAGQFIISGTQTGGTAHLDATGYALVAECQPHNNRIVSFGQTKPSSEAMTHGQIYQLEPPVNAVIHGHCPDIWQNASNLNLAQTDQDVPYGTVEMSKEVARLFAQTNVSQDKIFSMAGHEDGVVSFGHNLREAFDIFSSTLAKALQINNRKQS